MSKAMLDDAMDCTKEHLINPSWRRLISYRNQSIDLLRKSVDWFLYDIGQRHERVKYTINPIGKSDENHNKNKATALIL